MLPVMKMFMTDKQKSQSERPHDTRRDKRVCSRIKAVLLASESGISVIMQNKPHY